MELANDLQIDARVTSPEAVGIASADPLPSGTRGAAVLTITLADSLSGIDAGIPGFIVQLDPPVGLELEGTRVLSFEDQRDNEFLMEPWERLLDDGSVHVPFQVVDELAPDATLGINVVGYVTSKATGEVAFVRRRLELPLHPAAVAQPGDHRNSAWGPFDDARETDVREPRPLGIGDRAPSFDVPSVTPGQAFHAVEHLGKTPTVIATYRGFW